MATVAGLYHVEHWQYRAEGNANLVLCYAGPDPRFVAITLPSEFLVSLAAAVEPLRPQSRLHKVIDCTQSVGFLALDHTQFIQRHPKHPSVAVEIKPKWGFLSKSSFIRKEHGIKKRKCRFCMYQYHKLKAGQEQSLSEYCPIDLFSTSHHLVQDSLNALVQTPQNNFRLFVNGEQQTVSKEAIAHVMVGSNVGSAQQENIAPQGTHPTTLVEVLARVLSESPLLKRLGRLQQALDSLDVETIHRFYDKLADPATSYLPEPTLEEFLNTAEAFLERTDLDAMMQEDQETFETHNEASIGFGADDDLDEVPDHLKMHFVREFLLSATLKDCSILITIRRDGQAEEKRDTTSQPAIRMDKLDENAVEFRERVHHIEVNGESYQYKITCIDLDPKKIVSVPMYLKKDRAIVDHYLAVVGDKEKSCTFVYFAPGAVFVTSTLLPHLVLVLGATISLVSFLGYYGVMNEKRWILWLHGLILLIAIALQITVGAIAFVYRNQGNEVLDKAWDRVFRSDPRVIQDLESIFQCCGFENVLDRAVPVTCALDHHYMTGCRENIQTAFQDSLQAIGVIGAILGGIELVSLLGAAILYHRFDKQKYERERDEGEATLVRALLEAQNVERQIEEARRERDRDMSYRALAQQVRAQTLARAEEEGLLARDGGGAGGVGLGRQSRKGAHDGGRAPRDPPPYGTFDSTTPGTL
ncbi:Inositol-pentakisphosphate 2-kinase [Mortierella antarctica]|nr:Inositol-pentakisphosphate 2-kinase [Mortierella antarctica]